MLCNGFRALRQGHGRAARAKPELVLNNFDTRLGHRMGRMFASLFHQDPSFRSRQVATLHNQRDFIFFRWVWRVPLLSISSPLFTISGKPSPAPSTSFGSLHNERCATVDMHSRTVSQAAWICKEQASNKRGAGMGCGHSTWSAWWLSTVVALISRDFWCIVRRGTSARQAGSHTAQDETCCAYTGTIGTSSRRRSSPRMGSRAPQWARACRSWGPDLPSSCAACR